METQRVSFSPAPYIIFGIILFMLGISGQILSFPTLMPSLPIALLCLVLGFLIRRSRVLLLIDVWLFAYLYLYLSEYLLARDELLTFFGGFIANLTEGFIVASFGATLIGYGFVARIFKPNLRPTLNQKFTKMASANRHPILNKRTLVLAEGQPDAVRESLPLAIGIFAIFMAIVCVYYITQVISLQQLLFVGRSQRVLNVNVGLLRSFLDASVVAFPAVVIFLSRKYIIPKLLQLVLMTVVGVALLGIVLSGTRFLMGFQLSAIIFLLLPMVNVSLKHWFAIVLLAILVLMGSQIMLNTRSVGVGTVSFAEATEGLVQPERYLIGEGDLYVNALIHLRHAYPVRDRLPENLFIVYWWVPRAWWPDKPTMAGNWVIRELSSQRGFSEGHSASGGFGMPALLDFGPIAGAFFSIVYGFLLGRFEVYAEKHRDFQYPAAILIGLIYFAVFFMMRSLHTSLIFLMVVGLVSVIPLNLLMRFSSSRSEKRVDYAVTKAVTK